MPLSDLQTVGERNARPRACPKTGIPPSLERKERQKTKKQLEEEFRDAVWSRDKGVSRATGKPLVHGGTTDPARLGEVDHAIPRSLAPERLYDVTNGILLSKEENRWRKVVCREQPEFKVFNYSGPDDRGKPQTFIWRDYKTGAITRKHVG